MQKQYTTKSSEETQALAQEVAQYVKDGGVICLFGDLGSGKTTFTQGLARVLGSQRHIQSPTFLVVRSYELADRMMYHLDLYRLTSEVEIIQTGFNEFIDNRENIVVIEWSEKLGELLPAQRLEIYFQYVNETTRIITVKQYE